MLQIGFKVMPHQKLKSKNRPVKVRATLQYLDGAAGVDEQSICKLSKSLVLIQLGNINKNSFDKAPLAFFKSSWVCSLESTAKERASDIESTLSLLVRSTGMSAVPKKYHEK
jgi:hypothetical protein